MRDKAAGSSRTRALEAVEIRWLDSIRADDSWKPLDDLLAENVDRYLEHRSVGFLADETDVSILLVTSFQEELADGDRNVQGGLRIPKVAILSRRTLGKR